VLTQPFAWETLKRALRSRRLRIETPGESIGFISTVTLEPETIPLDVKVVLLGEPQLYYVLTESDPEAGELFKVVADFDNRMDRSTGTALQYAKLIATLARRENLKSLDRGAMARVVEHGARLAGDAEKLSTHMGSIVDLVREADFWAGEDGAAVVGAAHVQRAIDARIYRVDRVRERIQEEIQRGTLLVETDGERVGQINGLAVLQMHDFAFGRPTRISCRVRLGKGQVVDIEREVALGGPLHSKGVLILASYLGTRFAREMPLSLSASLVFEQSYSGVDGDSASSAELYALLSALSGIPIRQGWAVTGSVDQHGRVQAIGGVNEKIEGFFEVCRARGLTGRQGVLIPAANVKHLMLRRDVVEAAARRPFMSTRWNPSIRHRDPDGTPRASRCQGCFSDCSVQSRWVRGLERLARWSASREKRPPERRPNVTTRAKADRAAGTPPDRQDHWNRMIAQRGGEGGPVEKRASKFRRSRSRSNSTMNLRVIPSCSTLAGWRSHWPSQWACSHEATSPVGTRVVKIMPQNRLPIISPSPANADRKPRSPSEV